MNTFSRLLPRRADYHGLRGSWKNDLAAGLTVGVVALPLALAFGISSGIGAAPGLFTAIVAGFVAAVLGGSNIQVSGPTGAMAVVLLPVASRYGVTAVYTIGLLAGALVLLAGVLRLGRYVAFVPWPVIEGFTVGIATLIFLQQVPSALGAAKPKGNNTAIVAAHALGRALAHGDPSALVIVAVVAVIMVTLPRLHRSLPASLVAVAVATILAEIAHLHATRIGAIPSTLPTPSLPHLEISSNLFSAAVAIAALAALESLLSAKVADGLADTEKHDPDRELFGQGAANVASALFGGMPATGAIARTAVNVRAGGRTRAAAIVHSVFLVGVVLFAGSLVAKIPLAALAGVLMVTATRMVERHNVRAVILATRSDALVFALTAIATVAFDLVFAIELGMAVAAVLALRNVARSASVTPEDVTAEIDPDEAASLMHSGIVAYRLDGALFFGAAQRFLTELTAVTDVRVVVLRLPEIQVLDATGAQVLGEIVAELEARGITVLVKGPRPEHRRTLVAVGALDHLAHENHLFVDLDTALAHARRHVRRSATTRTVPE